MAGEVVSDFLAGGGELGALTRGFDWSKTSLGSPETWPQSLRVTVRLVLTSRHLMFICNLCDDLYPAKALPEMAPIGKVDAFSFFPRTLSAHES
jgi:hypothetical protein